MDRTRDRRPRPGQRRRDRRSRESRRLRHVLIPSDLVGELSADRVTRLLGVDDLLGIVGGGVFTTATLRVLKDGIVLPDALYVSDGTVDAVRVLALHEAGATVVVQKPHLHCAPVRELATEVGNLADRDVDTVAFWTPAGHQQGLAVHTDDHDVLVVQTVGSKEWEIHGPDGIDRPVLTAGQAMLIPEDVPHCARSRDEQSLHVSFAMFPRATAG